MRSDSLIILVPAYNPGADILDLLNTLGQASEHVDAELTVLVADDCSPNFSERDLRPARLKRVRLQYHRASRNSGEYANVNAAVRRLHQAGTDWFVLVHHDDFLTTHCLRFFYEYVANWKAGLPEMVFVQNTGIRSLGELPPGAFGPAAPVTQPVVDIPALQAGVDYISDHWAWIPSGTLFRTNAYLAMGGFFETLTFAGDNDFLVRWLLSGRAVRQVQRSLVYKRLHQGSMTAKNTRLGTDNEGWCYLMLRFAPYRSRTRNRQDHLHWMYRNARTMLTALKRRDPGLFRTRLRGVTIALRSLLAFYAPALKVLLPREVRRLLRVAPPIGVTASPAPLPQGADRSGP